MNLIVVSYYTVGTIYEKIVEKYLLPCLTEFNLPRHIFAIKDTGSWLENAKLQPTIILLAMQCYQNTNILWLDADTTIRFYPELFKLIPERSDIGTVWLEKEVHFGPQEPQTQLTTGVLYIKNSPKMKAFVQEWEKQTLETNKSYRTILAELIIEKKYEMSGFLIPRAYGYVPTKENGELPYIPLTDPIVVQHRLSNGGKINLTEAMI